MSDYVEVPLSRGLVALVDAADADLVLAAGKWHARPEGITAYAQKKVRRLDGSRANLQLHTFLTGWALVDHHNGDGLDNRRANLRDASKSQNGANRRLGRNNTSGFKGVTWASGRGRWAARITLDRGRRHLGYYTTPEEAARAYDAAARELFGEFARLNMPEGVELIATA